MKELNHTNYLFVNQGTLALTARSQDVSFHPKQIKEHKMKHLVRYSIRL